MLKILTPLEMVHRVDVTAAALVFTSGTTGSWVQLASDGSGNPVAALASNPSGLAWAVWTEGIRKVDTTYPAGLGQLAPAYAGGQGFSPDAVRTGKVTTLVGKWRGLTDQVDLANYAIGDLLTVSSTSVGKLTKYTATWGGGATNSGISQATLNYPVAVIRSGPHTTYSYLGSTYTGVYEIENLV